MKTRVANLRKVDWRRVQANFFVVFPRRRAGGSAGIFIVTTRVADARQSSAMQRDLVKKFPNVSSIDFTLRVASSSKELFRKISFANPVYGPVHRGYWG